MTYWLSGYLEGLDRGYHLANADMDHAWANIAHTVHAAAKLEPYTLAERTRKARQAASCEAQKRDAVPWPEEVDP